MLHFKQNQFISKESTLQIKGVAILLMLFLHLFNNSSRYDGMESLFYIGTEPLCWWISQICGICVPIYLILSGYGLWIVYNRGTKMHNLRRVIFLFLNACLVGFLFFPLSYFFRESPYSYDFTKLLFSLTGIDPYNGEWWFLFPWAMICLCSKYIFRIVEKMGTLKSLIFFYILTTLVSWFISRHGGFLYVMPWRIPYQGILFINLLFPFILGALAAKTGVFAYVQSLQGKQKCVICAVVFVALFIRMFLFHHSTFNSFLAFGVCCVFLMFKNNVLLTNLGTRSTNMWLTHTFFCVYYFHDFFESMKYPIWMFLVLVLYSYIVACFIDYFFLPMKQGILAKLK